MDQCGVVWRPRAGGELRVMLADPTAGGDATARTLDLDCDGHEVAPNNSGADCDDTRARFHAGAAELCDMEDTNCDDVRTITVPVSEHERVQRHGRRAVRRHDRNDQPELRARSDVRVRERRHGLHEVHPRARDRHAAARRDRAVSAGHRPAVDAEPVRRRLAVRGPGARHARRLGGEGRDDLGDARIDRDLKTYSPDMWAELGTGSVTPRGRARRPVRQRQPPRRPRHLSARPTSASSAAPPRLTWKGVEGKLRLGIEGGFATGDQWDNLVTGHTNIAYANQLGRPVDLQRAAHVHAHAVHVQPRLPGRPDLLAPPRRCGHERGVRQAVPGVRPHQVDHVQGRGRDVVRAQADRHAGQQRPSTAPSSTANLATRAAAVYLGLSFGVLFPFGAMAHNAPRHERSRVPATTGARIRSRGSRTPVTRARRTPSSRASSSMF